MRAGPSRLAAVAAALALVAARGHAEQARPVDGDEEPPPAAASSRRLLDEPAGRSPSPWLALSAAFEGGVRLEGESGWASARVHVPVARGYGAVDVRLALGFDGEGLVGIEPELVLRAVPLRLAGGRGVLGVAAGVSPTMEGPDPRLGLRGGVMGGYLARLWVARGFVGVGGELLVRAAAPELLATAALGLRLAHGLRPGLEADLAWPLEPGLEPELVLRPLFRYWPAGWIGLGLSADVGVVGAGAPWGALRLDVVLHALE